MNKKVKMSSFLGRARHPQPIGPRKTIRRNGAHGVYKMGRRYEGRLARPRHPSWGVPFAKRAKLEPVWPWERMLIDASRRRSRN